MSRLWYIITKASLSGSPTASCRHRSGNCETDAVKLHNEAQNLNCKVVANDEHVKQIDKNEQRRDQPVSSARTEPVVESGPGK